MNKAKGNTHYDGKIAGLYDLGDTLGRGHFAVVKLARHVFTGEQVAVKVIDKTKLDDVSRAHLFQEVRCMKLVQHPNVVRLYDVIDTQTKLYLILELGDGGDMYDYIIKHENGVDEETAKKYFRQIVHAISYCHKLHVVHRDLKPENVVFFEKLGMVKLTDFGFSNKFCPGQKLETSCGSLAYSAPEILLGDSYDAPKVDVWSLGVILYMLVCGHAPFQEANDSETLTMIMDCKYTIPQHISSECCRLIGEMLIRDPDKRATLEQITNDPWLNSGDAIQPADYLPLVSREHLSDEDHAHILQKMVNGTIAAKEDIIEALDRNEYNHITATYFLLAERKLRAQRQERAQMINSRTSRSDLSPIAVTPSISSAVPSPAQEKSITSVEGLLSPCMLSKPLDIRSFVSHLIPPSYVPVSSVLASESPAIPLQRKCSIVREEEDNCSTASGSSSPTKSPTIENRCLENRISRKTEQLASKQVSVESGTETKCPSPRPPFFLPVTNSSSTLPPISTRTSTSVSGKPLFISSGLTCQKLKSQQSLNRKLHSVQSSPQLPLKEINEEKNNHDPVVLRNGSPKKKIHVGKMSCQSTVISHVMLKMMEQHCKTDKSLTSSCNNLDLKSESYEITKIRTLQGTSKNCKKIVMGMIEDNGSLGSIIKDKLKYHSPSKVILHDSPNHSCCKCEDFKASKNNSFSHSAFSGGSSDSLDILSDNQPRLVNSMSCGNLSSDVIQFPCQEKSVVRSDSISLTEIPQCLPDAETCDVETLPTNLHSDSSAKTSCVIGNSVSLSSGLSTLQRQKLNLKDNMYGSQPCARENVKNSCSLGLGKLVQTSSRSASKQQLDINQNGWKKTENSKRNLSGKNSSGQQAVVDMKLASKCCTLC